MIKIAIIICGQPRYLDECANSIKNYFNLPEGLQADYFIHSWTDISYLGGQKYDTSVFDENELKQKLIRTYNPRKIIVEEQDKCEGLNEGIEKIQRVLEKADQSTITDLGPYGRMKVMTNRGIINHWVFGQTYSLQEATKLMYAEGVDYNLVVKIRTDLFFEKHSSVERARFFHTNPRKCLLTPDPRQAIRGRKKISDILIAADKDSFNLLFSDIYDYSVENIIKIIKDKPKIIMYKSGDKENPLFDGLPYTAARKAQENSIPIKYKSYNQRFFLWRKSNFFQQNKEII